METIRNVASVFGCVISGITLAGILIKPLRKRVQSYIKGVSNECETAQQLEEIKAMIAEQNRANEEFQTRIQENMDITIEFTEKQCRNILKVMFYKYRDTKVLPLYEKKTLLDLEDLYINKLHKNHWGKTLIDEMDTWEVDSSISCEGEFED